MPSTGGRYSALSNFDMAPAAACGLDVACLFETAEIMAHACAPGVPARNHPGLARCGDRHLRLLDRVGQRRLLIPGMAGMAVDLITVAVVFGIGGDHLHGVRAVVAIVALALYTGSFAIGLGPAF